MNSQWHFEFYSMSYNKNERVIRVDPSSKSINDRIDNVDKEMIIVPSSTSSRNIFHDGRLLAIVGGDGNFHLYLLDTNASGTNIDPWAALLCGSFSGLMCIVLLMLILTIVWTKWANKKECIRHCIRMGCNDIHKRADHRREAHDMNDMSKHINNCIIEMCSNSNAKDKWHEDETSSSDGYCQLY